LVYVFVCFLAHSQVQISADATIGCMRLTFLKHFTHLAKDEPFFAYKLIAGSRQAHTNVHLWLTARCFFNGAGHHQSDESLWIAFGFESAANQLALQPNPGRMSS
jgi:hypothetical protein